MAAVSLLVFAAVFFLFNLNFQAYWLAAALILFIFLIAMAVSFIHYKKERDRDLKEIWL